MSNAPQSADNEFDEEIFDIFVEEATEVLEALEGDLPKWQADHGNRPVLTDIRRAFHTLKGSGRMAKAMEIAEIAWKVEQALNKALDGSLEISNALIDMVGKARNAIPPLVEALRNREPVSLTDGQLARLCAHIEAVGRGETIPTLEVAASMPAPATAAVPTVPAVSFADLEPLRLELADVSMRLDTVNSGVEAGVSQVRELSGRVGRLESAVSGAISQDELKEPRAQIQTLNNSMAELRHLMKATNDRNAQQYEEVRQSLDQRVTDEVATLMQRNSEMAEQLKKMQQQLQESRRWTLLTVGSCVGGAVVLWLITTLLMR